MKSERLLAAALLALASSSALAAYTVTARTSSVTKVYWGSGADTTNVLASTTSFGPFEYDITSQYAMQASYLQPLGATYSGKCSAGSTCCSSPSGSYTISKFELRFTLTIPTVFNIDGSIQHRFGARSTLLLQGFNSLSGIKYEATGGNAVPYDPVPVHLTGTLPAGNYRLVMTDDGNHAGPIIGTGSASNFVFKLQSCAGDLSADALVDDTDFALFAAAYDILDCSSPTMPATCPADLNHDTFVDDADFALFATAYDSLLCP